MTDLACRSTRLSTRARISSLAPSGSWERSTIAEIRATVLAGIWLGALVGGLGGRLAMLALRLLSPDTVHGVVSDDGFVIGEVTAGGTYSLVATGAFFGLLGACAYRWVDHWLLGPGWFRQVTSALGAGAVVGSMLVHVDGVDFRLLRPLWLAVAFFVLIPAVFGFFIGPLEKALVRPDAWVNRGRRGWIVPVVTILAAPPMVIVVAIVTGLRWVAAAIRQTPSPVPIRDNPIFGVLVRGAWLSAAVVGLVTLINDTHEILS